MEDPAADTVTQSGGTNADAGGVSEGGDETQRTTDAGASTSTATQAQPNEDGVTEEQIAAIKANPELSKIYDSLNKGWTQKTQRLSAAKRFMDEVARDPHGAVRALAERTGFKFDQPAATTETQTEVDPELESALTEALGDKDIAAKLAPALQKVIDKKVGPISERTENMMVQSAMQESEAIIEAFAASHPDYKEHEEAMTEMSNKILPGKGMGVTEYLGILLNAVKGNGSKGDAIKEVVARQTKTAASTPAKAASVHAKQTVVKAPKNPTFEQAAEAARNGVVWQ